MTTNPTAQDSAVYKYRPTKLRTGPSKNDKSFIGHPGGLPWMLQVEMWERFSWFGMRAILLYFLTDVAANQGLGLSDTAGQVIVSAYGAAVLLMTIPGGIIADRILGPWISGLIGGSVIMLGHVLLAFPAAITSWSGLICIAIGTGLIKPNLATIVGGLYDEDDPRRDAGFQYFYMSVNVGSLVAPLIVGFLRGHFGYHVGFLAAAVGMALALVSFFYGRHKLGEFAYRIPNPLQKGEGARLALGGLGVVVIATLLVLGFNALLGELHSAIAYSLFAFALVMSAYYFLTMFKSPKVTAEERTHLGAFLPLWVGQILFVVIFEQAAGKMAFFAENNTDRTIGALNLPRGLPVHQPRRGALALAGDRVDLHTPQGQVPEHGRKVRTFSRHHRAVGIAHGLRLRNVAGCGHARPVLVPGPRVRRADGCRAVHEPRRPLGDDQARTEAVCLADHDPLVPCAERRHGSHVGDYRPGEEGKPR